MKEINVIEIKEKLLEGFKLLDVRTLEEFQEVHVSKAIHLPLNELTEDNLISTIGTSKNILLICRSGQRSAKACEIISTFSPEYNLYNVKGGTLEAIKNNCL